MRITKTRLETLLQSPKGPSKLTYPHPPTSKVTERFPGTLKPHYEAF